MMRRSWSTIDWPVDGDEIDDLIADTSVTNLDAAYLADRAGADQRGLGAIEYLLSAGAGSGNSGDDAAVTALRDPRRCGYLEGAARVIATEASLLVEDWTRAYRGGASYRDKLGDSANTGDLDSLVNDVIFLFEKMTGAELGRALGLTGDADPTAIVEGPATLGTADAAARLAGLRDALVGAPGHGDGLAPLLGSDLTERLRGQFAAADAAIAPLPSSLRAAVVTDPDAVARLRDAVMALQVTVSTEVVSKLGVVLGFADADGDSG
jgi:predicted lipoprotein